MEKDTRRRDKRVRARKRIGCKIQNGMSRSLASKSFKRPIKGYVEDDIVYEISSKNE